MFDFGSGTNDQLFGYLDYSFPPPVQGLPLQEEEAVGGSVVNTVVVLGSIERPE